MVSRKIPAGSSAISSRHSRMISSCTSPAIQPPVFSNLLISKVSAFFVTRRYALNRRIEKFRIFAGEGHFLRRPLATMLLLQDESILRENTQSSYNGSYS